MRLKVQAVIEGQMATPGFLAGAHPELLILYRYLARAMLDGSPAAAAMFDEMVGLGEEWLAEHHPGRIEDPQAYSALLVAMELGALFMKDQLSRTLRTDVLSQDGHLRLSKAKIDFYSQPLLSPDLAAQAHAAIDRIQTSRPASSARPRSASSRPRK
jgi:hypothetical protein